MPAAPMKKILEAAKQSLPAERAHAADALAAQKFAPRISDKSAPGHECFAGNMDSAWHAFCYIKTQMLFTSIFNCGILADENKDAFLTLKIK